MEDNKKARVIAFYLPQYHPIPENDKWWGKGYTEWTTVGKAKPLFRGHYQPRVPADLGYYDLRMPEVREAQAEMAREAGIEGFCYWHYWFGNGKQLLERPFNEVLESGKPDFPFCLGWANHSWYAKNWNKKNVNGKDKLLIKQNYLGEEDIKNHFFLVLKAFKDKRYLTVDEKPIFFIYSPKNIPDIRLFISVWQKLAVENGLNGIYFIGRTSINEDYKDIFNMGIDGICREGIESALYKINGKYAYKILRKIRLLIDSKFVPLNKYKYSYFVKYLLEPKLDAVENIYPTVIPNFDHSPRSDRHGLIIYNSSPEYFKAHFKEALQIVANKEKEHRIIFLKSWNEWGEGNYMEPDIFHGKGYLEALKSELYV